MRQLKATLLVLALSLVSLGAQTSAANAKLWSKIVARLENSAMVLQEIMKTPEKAIPQSLLDSAVCVGVIPAVKTGAFLVGAAYGRGVMECRQNGSGPWGPPLMIGLHAGRYGFQWGAKATDLVFVVRNPGGARALLKSKGVLGADASVTAGPVGRTVQAETDLRIHAQILTYARSRGLFAGISLKGAAITPDTEANVALYGHLVDSQELLFEPDGKLPSEAKPLIAALAKYSPRGGSASAYGRPAEPNRQQVD